MLTDLYIQNFAIIDELHLRFGPGLNILTGETGAGKSIIVDAVSLLLGGRADATMIRAGAEWALVEGTFRLSPALQSVINPLLEADGLEGETPDVLLLARELRSGGRSLCRVNGRAVPLHRLEAIAERLVDIHGQSEHLSLLRVREHIGLLDRFAGLEEDRETLAERVRALRQVRHELATLRRDERELARRADLLQFQVNEIAAARLEPGEDQRLLEERNRLAYAERLIEWAEAAFQALHEGSGGRPSAADLLGEAVAALSRLVKVDPTMSEWAETAENLAAQVGELARALRDYADGIEYNPVRLAEVEERLGLIANLKRKYGDSIEEILRFGQAAAAELETLTHSEERLVELEAEEERLLREIGRLGAELSLRRREAAKRLAVAIEDELAELRMAQAQFVVDFAWADDPTGAWVDDRRVAFDITGLDRVEFLVSANPGEPPRPLVKVASGGETSRLMLALKTVLAGADETPTLIFDEIDQGIGGRVGGVVGRKLRGLTEPRAEGRAHQVLCVTHLPQLAAHGERHFRVAKRIVEGRTITVVEELEGQSRVEELAQMLGAITEATLQSAAELLSQSKSQGENC